jgi:hypothetical protein
MDVFGTNYPTPDGTCIRDYIHVSDLVAAHSDALAYLRGGGASATLNCGYGRGFSVLDVIETVKRVSDVDFKVEFAGRRAGDPAHIVAAADRARSTLKWQPHFDDLQTIVGHALAWERKLAMPTKTSCRTSGSSGERLSLAGALRGIGGDRVSMGQSWLRFERRVAAKRQCRARMDRPPGLLAHQPELRAVSGPSQDAAL